METVFTGAIICPECYHVNAYDNESCFFVDGDSTEMLCKKCGARIAPHTSTLEEKLRTLAQLDGALTMRQKCKHSWRHIPDEIQGLKKFHCYKCDSDGYWFRETDAVAFGDGKPLYDKGLSAVLSLCYRLGLYTQMRCNPAFPFPFKFFVMDPYRRNQRAWTRCFDNDEEGRELVVDAVLKVAKWRVSE